MAPRFNSEPRSTSSWLRRDDAPSVMDSMESSSSIWSMRIFADSAISASVASAASKPMSSGRGAPEGAVGTGRRFVAAAGGFFEHSPWVAERAWEKRPFASVADLHEKMCSAVRAASADEQLALIRAHPDLVGRLAREGRLTRESTAEQASAGLSQLTDEEIAAFERYNAAYRERFGFPFVICARENKKDAILAAFPVRLQNPREQEIAAALREIEKIARLRIEGAVDD